MCDDEEHGYDERVTTHEDVEAASLPGSAAVGYRMGAARNAWDRSVEQAQIDTVWYMKWSMISVAVFSGLTTLAAVTTATMAYLAWAYPHH